MAVRKMQLKANASALKWNTAANWEELPGKTTAATVPTAEDVVILAKGSASCEINVGAKCMCLDAAEYEKTLSFTGTNSITIGGSVVEEVEESGGIAKGFWALRFSNKMTYTITESNNMTFKSTSGTQQKVKWNGNKPFSVKFEGVGSSYKVEDKISQASNASVLVHTQGTLNCKGLELDIGMFEGTSAGTRELNIEECTIKIKQTSATVWNNTTGTGQTVKSTGATIEIATIEPATGTISLFAGGGKSWGTLILGNSASTYPGIEISGANTFAEIRNNMAKVRVEPEIKFTSGSEEAELISGATIPKGVELVKAGVLPVGTVVTEGAIVAGKLKMNNKAEKTESVKVEAFAPGLILKAGETQNVEAFVTNGKSATEPARIASSTSGSQALMKKASGNVSIEWVRIKDSKVDFTTPAWVAHNSVRVANDTNWTFPVDLTATLSGSGEISSKILAKDKLTASLAATGEVSGKVKVVAGMKTTEEGVGKVAASVALKQSLNATVAGTATLSSTVKAKTALNGSLAGVGTITSTVHVVDAEGALIKATAELSSNIHQALPLTGSVAGVGKLASSLKTTTPIVGSLSATASLSSKLLGAVHLTGSIAGKGTLSGILLTSTPGSVNLKAVSSISATLLALDHVKATLSGSATLGSSLRVGQALGIASVASSASLAASVHPLTHVRATIGGTGTLAAIVKPRMAISATISATAKLTGLVIVSHSTTFTVVIKSTATLSAWIKVHQPGPGRIHVTSPGHIVGSRGQIPGVIG